MACTLFGIAVRRCKCGKAGEHQEKKLFIDNTVQALLPFKDRHKGLLKLYVQLREGVSVWGKKDGISFEVEK